MRRTATVHGRRSEGVKAVLSAVAVVSGTWLSGVVDTSATESNVNEAIGEIDDVWTWVADSPAVDARSDEPVVSYFDVSCSADGTDAVRASARNGRES